jgi:hypothetical protein
MMIVCQIGVRLAVLSFDQALIGWIVENFITNNECEADETLSIYCHPSVFLQRPA